MSVMDCEISLEEIITCPSMGKDRSRDHSSLSKTTYNKPFPGIATSMRILKSAFLVEKMFPRQFYIRKMKRFFAAATNDDITTIKCFIEQGVDVNFPNTSEGHATALHYAAWKGNLNVVKFLLGQSADPNLSDNFGWTPLIVASLYGHKEIVQFLISHGADVNAKNDRGSTALIRASANGRSEIVALLLECGADINARTNDGWTALIEASRYGHYETAKMLVSRVADDTVKDNVKDSALSVAIKKGHGKIAGLLLEASTSRENSDT